MMARETLRFFDTTLRDGEQTPGVSLNEQQKFEIAQALDAIGVDVIEAGFAVSSEGERHSIKTIASAGLKAEICSLARCNKKDIDDAIKCGADSVHVFIGTSSLHREFKLKMNKEEILEKAVESVQYVKEHGMVCEFSAEDATRTEIPYLKKVYSAVQEAGVDRINVPDTVGVMDPYSMEKLIRELSKTIKVPISVHCHNDFGLAVANTLASIKAGAIQSHTTINGLGERAGNADFEQVVMGVERLFGYKTKIKKERIYQTSKLVERLTGVRMPPNFPIVGDNAFAHEAGIHVHGVLANARTYEPITPEDVGARRRLVLGKHVGAHGVAAKLKELRIEASDDQIKEITKKVKDLGDKSKRVTEEDLLAIAQDITGSVPKEKRLVELLDLEIHDKLGKKSVASVKLKVRGKVVESKSDGVGTVDAALNAIKTAMKGYGTISLDEYHLDAITGGSDALAEVTVKVSDSKNKSALARGVHENVIMASVLAFISGLNRILSK